MSERRVAQNKKPNTKIKVEEGECWLYLQELVDRNWQRKRRASRIEENKSQEVRKSQDNEGQTITPRGKRRIGWG
jgi:hypothetical protein